MAFQPILDLRVRRPWAYEALVRGPDGEPASDVFTKVTPENLYSFDQKCRVAAIKAAVAAGILETDASLSINFLPNAVYSAKACIRLTLATAEQCGLPLERLIFEFTEHEEMGDPAHVMSIVDTYREMGFRTALDDFGAGHANLNLLSNFRTDIIKLDMALVRGIDSDRTRQHIVSAMVRLSQDLDRGLVAEGVESRGELETIRALGIDLVQGYFIARPAFERLPAINPVVSRHG
ncbi:EAL domain-containing protein [Xanthobacteraceae bacterium A53D]